MTIITLQTVGRSGHNYDYNYAHMGMDGYNYGYNYTHIAAHGEAWI